MIKVGTLDLLFQLKRFNQLNIYLSIKFVLTYTNKFHIEEN